MRRVLCLIAIALFFVGCPATIAPVVGNWYLSMTGDGGGIPIDADAAITFGRDGTAVWHFLGGDAICDYVFEQGSVFFDGELLLLDGLDEPVLIVGELEVNGDVMSGIVSFIGIDGTADFAIVGYRVEK